jgi:hypothetical protein
MRITVQSVVAVAEHMRRGWSCEATLPEELALVQNGMVASFPLAATTVSFTFPLCM